MRSKHNTFLISVALVLTLVTASLFVLNDNSINTDQHDHEAAKMEETDSNQVSAPELSQSPNELTAMNSDEYSSELVYSEDSSEADEFGQSSYDDYMDNTEGAYDNHDSQQEEQAIPSSQSIASIEEERTVSEGMSQLPDNNDEGTDELSSEIRNASDYLEAEPEETICSNADYASAEKEFATSTDTIQQNGEDVSVADKQDIEDPAGPQNEVEDSIEIREIAENLDKSVSESETTSVTTQQNTEDINAVDLEEDKKPDDQQKEYEEHMKNPQISGDLDKSETEDFVSQDNSIDNTDSDVAGESAESEEFPQQLDGEQIITLLANSVISDSGTFASYSDSNDKEYKSIGSFGEQHTNCFSINTGASFNMWGGGQQFVAFNIKGLNDFSFLNFTICGENGTEGEMNVDIYVDREMEGTPDYNYHFNSCIIPVDAKIDIKGASYIGILVNNLSSHENRMVFYNLSVSDV